MKPDNFRFWRALALGECQAPKPLHRHRYKRKKASRTMREAVFERDGWRCFYCKRRVEAWGKSEVWTATVDHLTPVGKGGETVLPNLVTACFPCNNLRGDRDLEEFLATRPRS